MQFFRLWRLWLLAGLLCGLAMPLCAATAPAGTAIVNRATVRFFDEATGLNVTLQSNPVRAIVQAVEGLDLTPDNQVSVPPGAR